MRLNTFVLGDVVDENGDVKTSPFSIELNATQWLIVLSLLQSSELRNIDNLNFPSVMSDEIETEVSNIVSEICRLGTL